MGAKTAYGATVNASTENVSNIIASVDAKTIPVNADILGYIDTEDSNVLKNMTMTNFKAFLKTYFDTLYVAQ